MSATLPRDDDLPPDAWGQERADQFKAAFLEFLDHVWVSSKEKGWIILGQHLYDGQIRVINEIFDGLAVGIHDFKVLKSRQLGISTIIRALMLFWDGMFPGIIGSLMFDSAQHLDEARRELVTMLEKMPEEYEFPRKKFDNRYSVSLVNDSRVNLVAAGLKETKSSGALGRSSGVSIAHRSELCSYGNISGMEAWRASLARTNPNRLFIDESTARGPNIWKEIWDEAANDNRVRRIFVGWWSHPDQVMHDTDPDWHRYGSYPPSEQEMARIRAVKDQYGHTITAAQLAWIRREMNPAAEADGDTPPEFEGDTLRRQEQPWTADEAFLMTGSVFFDPLILTKQMNERASRKFKAYTFAFGEEFNYTTAFQSPNARSIHLKVWEEPVEDAVYIVSADPAFGHSERSDRSAIQVLRCYADGLDQVAEYASPLITTEQFAWAIAAIEGWYAGQSSHVYRILELNGPGDGVLAALKNLRRQLAMGYFGKALAERGLQDIQRNVHTYYYTRTDSMTPGRNRDWKTTPQNKVGLMERLRDFTHSGALWVRSMDTLEEMRTIAREGDTIEAQGSAKDDRVVSLAIGVRNWDQEVRRRLIAGKRTRAAEEMKRRMTVRDQIAMYNQSMFDQFMAGKRRIARQHFMAARRASWRSG